MSTRRMLALAAGLVILAVSAWLVTRSPGGPPHPQPVAETATEPEPAPATASITATLFYGSQDGQALVAFKTEVPFADDLVAQGREILAMQLEPAPNPYVSVIPEGTTLRAFYVTERGEGFVDLSSEISTNHPGGSFTELLTVYTIVNAVTANLAAVQRVQILIDGTEVDTLAGHVDLRRPLVRDDSLVREDDSR
jgi:spore germination protein GerM